jgi:predicted TIM-barrel fold metal-dependent hydrolase
MIIDIHNHHWSEASVPERFWDGLAKRVATVRSQREGVETTPEEVRRKLFKAFEDPTGEILIKEMDEAGIGVTALLALDLGLTMGEPKVSIQEQNRGLAELCRRYPRRLIPFVGIDPRRQGALEILERGLAEWGMGGVKFHPGAGWYPNDRSYYPIYEKACEYKVPVLFHTGSQLAPFRSIFSQPIYLDDVTIDFPDLTIIAAHLGVGWWRELASLIEKRKNLYADISGWQVYAMRSFPYFCRTLREILDIVGPGALLFGTDGPTFRLYSYTNKVWARTISELPKSAPAGIHFSQEEIEGILWKNASTFLKQTA